MDHPTPFRPEDLAVYEDERMGKSTIFQSDRLLVGLNAFEPGQEHRLHGHGGMETFYSVRAGWGVFLLDGGEEPLAAGMMLIAPEGVLHGIRNTGTERLLVLAILAPSP